MASGNKRRASGSAEVERSEEIVDRFLDAIWMERGLSANTLGAYRADLVSLQRWLSERDVARDCARALSQRDDTTPTTAATAAGETV